MQGHRESSRRQLKTSQTELKRRSRGREVAKEMELDEGEEENAKTGDKKRLRVSRACDQCRRRKDKCDGCRPVCQQCSAGNRVCTYDMSTKKRGLPTGYVRSLEILLGLVFHHIEGSEALVSFILSTDNSNLDSKVLSLLTGETRRAESLVEIWRKSKIAKQIELLLPSSESLEDEEAFSQRLSERVGFATSLVADQQTNPDGPPKTTTGSVVDIDVSFNPPFTLPAAETTLDLSLALLHGRNTFHIPSNWSQLLDLYFSNTHSWLPICQKQDLLRPAHMLSSMNNERTCSVTAGERAFLYAVIAYALHQYERTDFRVSNEKAHFQESSEDAISAAKSLVSLDCENLELGHVRALLVLGLLEMGRGGWKPAWVLMGQAIYVAIDLGIIGPPSHGSAESQSNDEGLKRLSHGCFVLDTLVSACLGRRPHLNRSDLQSIGVPKGDGIEEWETWQPSELQKFDDQNPIKPRRPAPGRSSSIFNHFVELIAILNDLIIPSHLPLKNASLIVSQDLDAWRQQLPSHCQIFARTEDQDDTRKPPQLLNLCLSFIFASSLLRIQLGELIPTSERGLSMTWDSSMDHLFEVVSEHIHKYGSLWMPLAFFKKFQGSYNSLQQSQTDTISEQSSLLTVTNHHQDDLATALNKDIIATGPQVFGQLQFGILGNTSPVIGKDIQFVPSSMGNTEFTMQQDQTNIPQQLFIIGDIPSVPSHGINISTSAEPLGSIIDDDFLFNSLASLDPVDWTANQPEFMEHLGFTGDFLQSDYQSFFNT